MIMYKSMQLWNNFHYYVNLSYFYIVVSQLFVFMYPNCKLDAFIHTIYPIFPYCRILSTLYTCITQWIGNVYYAQKNACKFLVQQVFFFYCMIYFLNGFLLFPLFFIIILNIFDTKLKFNSLQYNFCMLIQFFFSMNF